MAKVIAIANQKGGTGKTTTCLCLGKGLAEAGKRVCFIDFDSQANLTTCLGFDPEEMEVTIGSALTDRIRRTGLYTGREYILQVGDVDLIPADLLLFELEELLSSGRVYNREYVLRKLIAELREEYDYILIDCMPSLNYLTINALAAADEVLIPMQAKFLSSKGREMLFKTIQMVQEEMNEGLRVNGLLFTMVKARAKHPRKLIADTIIQCGDEHYVYPVVIPDSVKVEESQEESRSILDYKNNIVAKSYRAFIEEFLQREGD